MPPEITRFLPLPICAAATLALAWAFTALSPNRYIATARVLAPAGMDTAAGLPSRVLKIEHVADDPRAAAQFVTREVETRASGLQILDGPSVRPEARGYGLNLAIGGALGLGLGAGLVVARERRRRPVRGEAQLIAALGEPIFAARTFQDAALDALAKQLLEQWFVGEQVLLPVVSALPAEGRTRLATELALRFSRLGARTLLLDADLRSPGLHRALGLRNREGLADLLAGRPVQFAECAQDLAAMVAGSVRGDPLELLRGERLHALLAASARHFRAIVIDTSAATRGPDLQIFAALARGALVVSQRSRAEAAALERLRATLEQASARVISTVVNPR
ncbi:MAG: CpsD/CapB family tyrosine-protein kinase [Betaproteobacteria bacterium]